MQKSETLTKLKTFNNHLFIFTSTSTYLRFSNALPSSFSHLPVRIAPSFIRLFLICPCGSHRSLFVHCSFIVRSLFVHCSFIVRLLFVFCSSFVHLYVAVVPPLEGVRGRFSSSFVYPPVWLTPHTVIDWVLLVFLAFLILISIINIFLVLWY